MSKWAVCQIVEKYLRIYIWLAVQINCIPTAKSTESGFHLVVRVVEYIYIHLQLGVFCTRAFNKTVENNEFDCRFRARILHTIAHVVAKYVMHFALTHKFIVNIPFLEIFECALGLCAHNLILKIGSLGEISHSLKQIYVLIEIYR